MDNVIECSYCGGDAYEMGSLGHVTHYRCRHCGFDTTVETGECEFGMHEEDYNDDHLSDLDVSVEEYVQVMWKP